MQNKILYIDAGLDISAINIFDATDYIYISEKNLFDDFTAIMQKNNWKMHTSAIYYNKTFYAEYYKENKKIVYHYNTDFLQDIYKITKLQNYNMIISHNQYYLHYVAEYLPNLTDNLVCI